MLILYLSNNQSYFEMQSELSFGADCVIRLEDLGEFKDYSDTLESLAASLQAIKNGKLIQVPQDLWEVVDSDPQDTFFLPDFQKVLALIASFDWSSLVTQQKNLKILSFYIRVVEEALISFTFSQQTIDTIINRIMQSKKQGAIIERLVLKLFFNLSDKVMYIEQTNKLALFWNSLSESDIFNCYEEKHRDVVAAVYSQCCEKYLRNRQLRKLIKSDENRPFLQLKLALWQRKFQKASNSVKNLQTKDYYGSKFLKEVCLSLQKTISK